MKSTQYIQIGLIGLLLVQLPAPVAEACTCGLGAGYPSNGDIDIPIDAELAYPSADDLEPRLFLADGTVVPTRIHSARSATLGEMYFLAPLQELEADTEYLLGGSQPLRFTTGRARASRELDPAEVIAFAAKHSDLSLCETTSCGLDFPATRISLQYQPSPQAVLYEVVITTESESWRRIVPASFYGTLGSFCQPGPPILPTENACAELIAIGANGARSAVGDIVCNGVELCEAGDCNFEALQECHTPAFVPGPIEVPAANPGDWGCSAGNNDTENLAFVLLALLLAAGSRRRRQEPFAAKTRR